MVQNHSSHKTEISPVMSALLSVFHHLQSSFLREAAIPGIHPHIQLSNPDSCRCHPPQSHRRFFPEGFTEIPPTTGCFLSTAASLGDARQPRWGSGLGAGSHSPKRDLSKQECECPHGPAPRPLCPLAAAAATATPCCHCAFTAAPPPGARTGQTSDWGVDVQLPG